MSALIVSRDCITRIVDAISDRFEKEEIEDIFGTAHKDTIGYQLWKMNYEAVNQRYKEADTAPDYRYPLASFCTTMQSFKSLRCYLYQCMEGDVPESRLFKKLQSFSETLGYSAAMDTAEYHEADWG